MWVAPGDDRCEGRAGGLSEDAAKHRRTSVIQKTTAGSWASQRQVLPSQGLSSPTPPALTGPFSPPVAHSLGPPPRANRGGCGRRQERPPSPATPVRLAAPCRAAANASTTCPPPAARPLAIGWRRRPSRGAGASPPGRRSNWSWRRRRRRRARPQRGGEAGGSGGGGTGGGCRFRNRRSTSVTRGLRGLGSSGRAARGRWEWRPPGGGRAGGAGKEAAGRRAEGRRGGRGGAGRLPRCRPGSRRAGRP